MGIEDSVRYILVSQYYGWKSFFIYRLQAVISLISTAVYMTTSILTIVVIYSVSTGIPGWDYYHLLFLSLLSGLTISMVGYFNFYNIPRLLREGNYDAYFTKPIGKLSLMLCSPNAVSSPTGIVATAALLCYVGSIIGFQIQNALLFLGMFAVGLAAFLLFLTMLSVLSYRLIKSGTFINRMANLVGKAAQYPLPIYGIAIQSVFSVMIPVGIAVYYPTEAFFGTISPTVCVYAVIVGVAVALLSRMALYRLMQGYSSGGG
jgi:ABC-2 type transport system permease protein